jgi:hypothetical protein
MNRVRGRRWAVVTSVAGTVFIAAGAFWLSFTALADLARRSGIGAGQAWAWWSRSPVRRRPGIRGRC